MPTPKVLSNRNYQLYFVGQGVSMTGTWLQQTAVSWLAYRLSGSAELLTTVTAAGQLPAFLLAPVAGALTDRVSKRAALIVSQLGAMLQAAALALLTWSGRVQIWQLIALSIFGGAVNAFDIVLRQTFVSELVAPEDLGNAIAVNSTLTNATRFVGPALAGFLIPVIGEAGCFGANALSFVAVISALLALEAPGKPAQAKTKLGGEILEGFRYAFRHPGVRAVLCLLSTISFCGLPYIPLMPVFAGDVLHGGSRELGLLMSATGLGALISGVHLATRAGAEGLERFVTLGAGVFGAAIVVFASSTWMPLSLGALVLAGYAMMTAATACNTIVQRAVEDSMRGRVMALILMAFMGLMPLGAVVVGKLAHNTGAPFAVRLGGAACVFGGILFGRRLEVAFAKPA